MFGIFSDPEKIASKVYTEAISPTIDIIQRLYERKTTQKDLPYDIWNNMYFVGFFLGLCINVISASQKRPPTAKDSQIAGLILFNYIVPTEFKSSVEHHLKNMNPTPEFSRGMQNGGDIVGFVFGIVRPEILMNEPHFVEANERAKEFIGKEVYIDEILTDPGYKEIMLEELINIIFISELVDEPPF